MVPEVLLHIYLDLPKENGHRAVGVVSLSAALALPLTLQGGSPFPRRDLILFLTFVVILATLVVQGLSLPPLIRWLELQGDRSMDREERVARLKANQAALARLGRPIHRRRSADQCLGLPVYRGGWFKIAHEQIWGAVNVLALVAIAMVWAHWATRDRRERGGGAPEGGRSRKFVGFFGRFALFFSIGFVAQWLGIAEPCGACFRSIGTSVFSSADGQRELDIERLGERDTRIVIVNRALMKPDGSGPVRNLDIRTSGAVWFPLCVYVALVLASPVCLGHRAGALALGVLALGGLLLLVTAFAIWNNSTEVGLVALSPGWKTVAETVQIRLQDFCGMGAPVVVWALLGFRRSGFVCGARPMGTALA